MTFAIEDPIGTPAWRAEIMAERRETRIERGNPPKGFLENGELLRAVIENPDDEAPRWAYAKWMLAQDDAESVKIGAYVEEALERAATLRANPHAIITPSIAQPTRGMLFDIALWLDFGILDWAEYSRGFIESVGVRANRLISISDELFSIAPIRYLKIVDLASAVDELAAWPGLQRIHSLSFLALEDNSDRLTDDVLERFLRSPYLTNVAVIWMSNQSLLTQRTFRNIVTTANLPKLSLLNVEPATLTCWKEPIPLQRKEGTLSYFEQVMQSPPPSGDLRVTPKPVILRPEDWIVELERDVGYQPCLHPEEHYGGYRIWSDAVIEHPIALDPTIMARRGEKVAELGPKPSLMERRVQGLCAICGSSSFAFEGGAPDLYGDPEGRFGGVWICEQCGTRWYADHWPEKR